MTPLKFEPILKTIVWGGEKIAPYKGIETEQKHIGESWELSGVAGNESVVADGPLKGKTIAQLVKEYKADLVGKHVYENTGDEFPLLIKFIDALTDLSIQVHPNDELAAKRHNGSKGKTEMWYVVDAEPGAHLLAGLTEQITPEQYAAKVADGTITDVLARYEVKPGDVFFLPAGRIHAICGGCFIAEIQQTSNITYRIYDYGRLGLDGKPREVHTELAKDAIDYTVYPTYRTDYTPAKDEEVEVVSCQYFTTSIYDLTLPYAKDLSQIDSFLVVMCLTGSGAIEVDGEEVPVHQGETVLIPAAADDICFVPDGSMKVLTSYIR
ncbi:MAG: class I mannose-6-phosphate isomerase [Bacteroidales bacterium]|nr:class I mannose-6-phosphate isomerase [Bacteroidales bacterium]